MVWDLASSVSVQPSSWAYYSSLTRLLSQNVVHSENHIRHSKIEYKFNSAVTGSVDRDVRL